MGLIFDCRGRSLNNIVEANFFLNPAFALTQGHIRTILSGNTCINLHKDMPSPTRLQLYLIGIHVVSLFLLTYASYIYKGLLSIG